MRGREVAEWRIGEEKGLVGARFDWGKPARFGFRFVASSGSVVC